MAVLPFGDYGFSIATDVIGIMIAISGMALGLGYAINQKSLKEFGKEELYQSIINGALVGGFLVLFANGGIVSNLINSITLSNGTSVTCNSYMANNAALCLSYGYLASPTGYTFMGVQYQSVLTTTTSMLTSLLALNGILGIIAAFKINLVVVTLSFNYVVSPIISEIAYLVKIMSTLSIGALVQASILMFVAASTLTLILPSGLILRAFYPTRKLGGFFIALSIGLYVVLPLSYVFNIMLINSYFSLNSTNLSQVTLTASGVENTFLSTNLAVNSTKASGVVGALTGAISSLQNSVYQVINGILSWLSSFIVATFILPAFSLIITGISVKEFADILGSEVSFGRFKVFI